MLRRMKRFKILMRKSTTREIFTVMAMVMWAMSFIASIVNPDYNPPDYVNPLIMLVGGYLFATASINRETVVRDTNGETHRDKELDKDKSNGS